MEEEWSNLVLHPGYERSYPEMHFMISVPISLAKASQVENIDFHMMGT